MIFKYIKPYAGGIALVVCLIIFQSMTELSLPEYTSNIVNVGIAQAGVEYAAPEIIGRERMESLFDAPGDPIYRYYNLILQGDMGYAVRYPDIVNQDLYLIDSSDPARLETVEPYFLTAFESAGQAAAINFIINEYKDIGVDMSYNQNSYIYSNGARMLLLALLSAAAAIFASFNSTRVAAGFARDLRKAVFSKVISFSNTEFDKFSTASLITRCTNDVQQLQMFLGMGMRIVIFAPAMGIGAILKVVKAESSLTWILAIAVGIIITVVAVLFAATSKKFRRIQELTDAANRTTREALSGLLVIRAFSNQKRSEERFDVVNKELSRTNRFITRTMGAMNPLMSLVMNLAVIAMIYFGASYVAAGIIQVGSIMAFIQYSSHVVMSFLFISMISIFLPRAMVSIHRIQEVLSSDISIKDPINPVSTGGSLKGLVEFRNVGFKYHEADERVLNNISFTAAPGETTAIIGTTGSGKSTVVNLIPRLYDATEGEILVDGVNIKDMSLKTLRDKISYAPQKGVLFSGTIESNIKFAGANLIDNEAMEEAARIAQAEEFVMEKENRYQADVAQGGANLSGGQRQRISISRALAKPAEIIIFDDSFSALDYKTDANLRRALKSQLQEKTIIIVAQRISTIRDAQKILVMDEGEIIGMGRHDELMETCEVYRQIASSQIGEGGGQ